MGYELHDTPRLLSLLSGSVDPSHSDTLLCERIDAQRAWEAMPDDTLKRLLWLICAEDCTLTNAATQCGVRLGYARPLLERGAARFLKMLDKRARERSLREQQQWEYI